MKKFLFLLLLPLSVAAFGQNLLHFDHPGSQWNVASTYPHANPQYPNFVETTTRVFGYNGDTLIGNETWLKMYRSPDSGFITNLTFMGLIREFNGTVVYQDTNHLIHPLYDFTLETGDSVLYPFASGGLYLKVETIDSIIIDGEYYKQFHFSEPWFPPLSLKEVWIEEIGSIHGPLFPAYPRFFETEIPDSAYLTCYQYDNSVLWENPSYSACFINIVLGGRELKNQEIKVIPNPAGDNLIIKFPANTKPADDIRVCDLQGRRIQCSFTRYPDFVETDISNLEKGIYFITIPGTGSFVKFIKQ